MSSNDIQLTLREKIGVGLFVAFGPILAELSWQYGQKLGANFTPLEIALIGAAGGGLAGYLMGKTPVLRMIGVGCGALAAFGCNYAFDLVYGGTNRAGSERIFIFLAGALPGILLGIALIVLAKKSAAKAAAPTAGN
jgi:hypothetical protein